MAGLSVSPHIPTKEEIEEYNIKCINNFKGVAGNIPFHQFLKENGRRIFAPVKENERYYLSSQPYAISSKIKDLNQLQLITGLRFRSLTTHEYTNVDIRTFMGGLRDIDTGIYVSSKGSINYHLNAILNNANPYLTLREVIDEMIQYIGKQHVYFTYETANNYFPNTESKHTFAIWSCHFAHGINENSR